MNKRETVLVCAEYGRRRVLKAFAGAVGGLALSACGGGSDAAPAMSGGSGGSSSALVPEASGAAPANQPSSVANELRVSLPSGTQANYPLQFGRAFAAGVVTGEPSVALDGIQLAAQQADVKTRHPDGSVKFAVISVVIPSLSTTERVLTIGNKAAATRRAETLANMLTRYDFEATIGVAVAGVQVAGAPVSARAMLQALTDSALATETAAGGVNARYWTVGPVCTTVLLCDHTTKAWDVGTSATKAIRPMFHVQFWPGIGRYHVRHIVEVADVTKLKDETGLDVTFTTGQASPVTRLSQSGAYVYAATFQTRAYWGGADMARANVKHGVAYMASTKALPNYDASIAINSASIGSYASDWSTKSKALGAAGYWQKAMASTGGRHDLGLMPKWDTVALYSGAAHMLEIVESQAEMAGSWRFFLREGSAGKNIFGEVGGQGRVISKLSRPTQFVYNGVVGALKTGSDGFTIDGVLAGSADAWAEDSAHTPGTFWFAYLTTGAAIWHERLQQLAAWSLFIVNPGTAFNGVGNGRSNTDLILNGLQSRGWGWQYRNRARAWWVSLDGSPERDLFNQSLVDAAAQRAGLYDVAGMLLDHPVREAWNSNQAAYYSYYGVVGRPNALHYWEAKGGYTETTFVGSMGSAPDDWAGTGQAGWMRHFITLCCYHAVELGVGVAQPLADWVAHQTIAIANSREPRHIADYVFPDLKASGGFYQTLEDVYDGYQNNADTDASPPSMPVNSALGFSGSGAPNTYSVTMENYGVIAASALSMSVGALGGARARDFVRPWYQNSVYFNHDPRYAIIPRS